jgi:hypothetical protein
MRIWFSDEVARSISWQLNMFDDCFWSVRSKCVRRQKIKHHECSNLRFIQLASEASPSEGEVKQEKAAGRSVKTLPPELEGLS